MKKTNLDFEEFKQKKIGEFNFKLRKNKRNLNQTMAKIQTKPKVNKSKFKLISINKNQFNRKS